jgi:hypothetical protein
LKPERVNVKEGSGYSEGVVVAIIPPIGAMCGLMSFGEAEGFVFAAEAA